MNEVCYSCRWRVRTWENWERNPQKEPPVGDWHCLNPHCGHYPTCARALATSCAGGKLWEQAKPLEGAR